MTEIEWLTQFGENLKSMLREANMTQKELAEDAELPESCISNYVQGKSIPTVKSIINICYSLACDTDELIDFGERIE